MSATPYRTATNLRLSFRALIFTMAIAPLSSYDTFAQTALPTNIASAATSLALPDSPGTHSSSVPFGVAAPAPASYASDLSLTTRFDAAFQNFPANNGLSAGRFDKYIEPDQQAPRLRFSDKLGMGMKDAISPFSVFGWATAAGFSQVIKGSPNYGTDGNASLQRFGAAAARASSEGIFSDSIMASVLHEDPRYYKIGRGHNVLGRILYAATRPLMTRTDGGRQTLNLAYLSGNLAGSALTQAYYPPVNRGASQVMQTWGGSIGGGAIGFLSSEFLDDILQSIHLRSPK